MSVYQASIKAFVKVIESQPHSLTIQDWVELEQINSNLPQDDDEEITEILEKWLKAASRSQLLQAYKDELKLLPLSDKLEVEIGRNASKSTTPPDQPSPSSQELLDNTIKNNSPLSDAQKTKQNP